MQRFNFIIRITHSFIILLMLDFTSQQHIFDKVCEYNVKLINKTETLRFASQNIHVSNDYYDVYVNFCDSLQKGELYDTNCNKQSWLCILKKKNRRYVVQRPVTYFLGSSKYINSSVPERIFLEANDVGECEDATFEFQVEVDRAAINYKISSPDPCVMEVTIPHPKTTLQGAVYSYNGLLIDMSALRSYPEQIIHLNDTMKIAMAVLRSAPSCANHGIICEINSNGKIFSVAEDQYVLYDYRSNMVTLRGKKTTGKLRSEVQVHCNWTAGLENFQKQLAKYKYTVESRYGCVKLPLNCQVSDYENYEYDISSLNKPSGWTVSGASDIKINICGTLQNPANTECAKKYSQVCSYQRNARGANYVSYGALHNGLQSDGQELKLTFTHGSRCFVKPDKAFTTNVVLQCNHNEMGPVLRTRENCTLDIVWKTPAACAKGIKASASFGYDTVVKNVKKFDDLSCDVSRNGQIYRLGSLKASGMIFESILRRNSLIYYVNICQPIAINKNNYYCGVTGACVEDKNEIDVRKRYIWVGNLLNPTFENDQVVIHYRGGACVNTTQREIVITFKCSLRQEPLRLSSEALCRADFTWNTPLVCNKKTTRSLNCQVVLSNGTLIDFAKLQRRVFVLSGSDEIQYKVDLCSNEIETNKTESIPDGLINTTREIRQYGCFYSLIYNFLTIDTNLKGVWSIAPSLINISLLCDEIANNLHVESGTRNRSEIFVQLKDNYFCNFHTCDDKKVELTTITATSVTTQLQHDSQLDTANKSQEPKKHFALNNCKVVNDRHELLLTSLNHHLVTKDFKLNKDVTYTIGDGVDGKLCNGFICRSNETLATLEICPMITFIEDVLKVELMLLGPTCGTGKDKQVKLVLKCLPHDSSGIGNVRLVSDDGCSAEILIENTDSCLFFARSPKTSGVTQGSSNTGYIIGIVVCSILAVLMSVMIWKYQTVASNCFKSTHCSPESPTRRVLLNMKEA